MATIFYYLNDVENGGETVCFFVFVFLQIFCNKNSRIFVVDFPESGTC
jgi:hypothetical protein